MSIHLNICHDLGGTHEVLRQSPKQQAEKMPLVTVLWMDMDRAALHCQVEIKYTANHSRIRKESLNERFSYQNG